MAVKIALAGNPNCGKTTMFNSLTGSNQYVGNWPGVTVEKKEGRMRGNKDIIVQDLPGIYSLSPYTLEEVVTRNYLINEKPDVILDVVDSSNIERNLYLTTQLIEIGLPVVIALNMIDIVRKNGDEIDAEKLGKMLGCEVIETSALKGEGSAEAAEKAALIAAHKKPTEPPHVFSGATEHAIAHIEDMICDKVDAQQIRWFSIKLFERDTKVQEQLGLDEPTKAKIEESIAACERELDDDCESIITNERYLYIDKLVAACVKRKPRKNNMSVSDRIDRILTNKWLALPIFAVIMFLVYYLAVSSIGAIATDWVNDVLFGDIIPTALSGWLTSINCADWLVSLILDGIVGGVGAVLGFLPQMAILFFLLAILEDCGYMSRIAFIMDKVFRKFGLSGKSFIPILIGTGCGVPGIMASRTIENERDRRMTIITTTFIPCGAKLPIIALIAGAMFGGEWWVAPSAYFVGIAAIVCSGVILKKTKPFLGEVAPFVMELPPYHAPSAKNLFLHTWDRVKSFVKKAGTIIFIASIIIWFLSNLNWQLQFTSADDSILASIGGVIAPIFSPLGWGKWEAAVSTLTGIAAKESVVSTFGVLFGFGEVAENGMEIWGSLQAAFTPLSAYSFLIFNLLCAPCVGAIGAIRREMNSAKWTWAAVGYQTGFAYIVSLCIYQFGMLFTGHGFGAGTVAAILLTIGFFYMLFRKPKNSVHKVQKEHKC